VADEHTRGRAAAPSAMRVFRRGAPLTVRVDPVGSSQRQSSAEYPGEQKCGHRRDEWAFELQHYSGYD